MDIEVRPCASVEELRDALNAISHYFGHENQLEDAERFAQLDRGRAHARRVRRRPHRRWGGRLHVSHVGARRRRRCRPRASPSSACCRRIVGAASLTSMMKAQLEDCRARGDLVAYLWASESTIYGRFGYGLASRIGAMRLAQDRSRFAQPFEPRGTVRLVELEEAARTFPPLYDAVCAQRPGHVLAQQGVVGDAQAVRRPRPPAGRAAEPRAARARRRARRLRALPRASRTGSTASARAS